MRKALLFLGLGLLSLGGILYFAEQKRADGSDLAAHDAIGDVLKAQNQSLAGRIFSGLSRADQTAADTLNRWAKKPKTRAYFSDTAFAEPDAPRWSIVDGRHVRAAGVVDDALLEDALDAHLNSSDRLALYNAKGKYYLFINGKVGGATYASAYEPEAFFSSFRSSDGIRSWLALHDGTVIYHPLSRFIGANVANMKPVAAGIQELDQNKSTPFSRRYQNLEGHEALGAFTPLPSYGLLVGSEWPKLPAGGGSASILFLLALAAGGTGLFLAGLAFAGRAEAAPQAAAPTMEETIFDENRLSEEALAYLEKAKAAADEAMAAADQSSREAEAMRRERDDLQDSVGALEWRSRVLDDYFDRVLPRLTGKQVWDAFGNVMTQYAPELSAIVYRYSPSSYALVPEQVFSRADLPGEAIAYMKDARIFVGNVNLMDNLAQTEAFLRWNKTRERQMPLHQTDFRVYAFQGPKDAVSNTRGALVLFYDRRLNGDAEIEASLRLFDVLIRRTATFCDTLQPLLQLNHAKGIATRPAVASAPNDSRNRPRPS